MILFALRGAEAPLFHGTAHTGRRKLRSQNIFNS